MSIRHKQDDVPHIATLSGGKDSTVMVDLLLRNGYRVDYIIFTDTLLEFPLMYEYIEKIKKYFKDRYGKEVITLKPKSTFEEWCFGTIKDTNAEFNGFVRGIPMVWSEPCYWRRQSKVRPSEKFEKEVLKGKPFKKYIGFTLNEQHRKSKDKENIYPLIDYFQMSESNCQEYLLNQEMENPLYRFFTRTGCGICPAQSDKAWYQVWKNFPDTWKYMQWIETRLLYYQKMGMNVKNCFWFTDHRSCEDMEKLFEEKEKQGSLFDFSDEPLKDCFCKI